MKCTYLTRWTIVVLWVANLGSPAYGAEKYSMKTVGVPPSSELKDGIKKLFSSDAVQVLDPKGQVLCEIWFRKAVPAKATAEQVKNGLTYRELEETTILGAIRFAQQGGDYRNQKVKPGVYTLRLAFQPLDGDHMGTAPHGEFCLLVAADQDEKPDAMDPKDLHNSSAKSMGGNHPGVFLLFPNEKPEAAPRLADQGMGHWTVKQSLPVEVNGKPAKIGIGLNVVGHSSAG